MILLTGGTGFIGATLVRALRARDIAVRVIGLKNVKAAGLAGAEYQPCDLCKIEPQSNIFDSVHTIVHLASTTIPATSMTDMSFDARSNIEMSLRLLEATRIRGIKNFIFASSGGTVYGDPLRLPAREDDATNPISSYGVVKLAIEKYVGLYSRLHGIRGVTLRITNPYGSGQFAEAAIGVIARLLRHARDGTALPVWGDGNVVRDYFHIDDLMKAFLLAIDPARVPAGSYNVGSGAGVSINQLIALAGAVTQREVLVKYETARSIDVAKIWVDTRKFRTASGWEPTISLDDGLRRLWRDLLENRQGSHGRTG